MACGSTRSRLSCQMKMQQIGTEMHHAASRFALAARDAGDTGEIRPTLTALAGVTAQCVAGHAAYRVR